MSDITRVRGDTYPDKWVVKDSSGTVVDITGYSFLLTVDSTENPTDVSTQQYQLTGTITNASAGLVEFSPSAVQADLLGRYYYDIQMTDASGNIETVKKAAYIFTQDITK